MISIRSQEYSSEENRIISLIFTYHVYPSDYTITNVDSDLLINEKQTISSDNQDHIEYKEENQIKYMNPLKIFKLPLSFAGFSSFLIDFKKLNSNVSDSDPNSKYKLILKQINPFEVEVLIVLQEDQSIVIYKFKDKLITIPKIDKNEILVERIIMSKKRYIFI
uniref:Uncharacterized protein n=1 Tax=Amanita muscaria TaxID=41956 RepID=A0A5Q0N2B0_AMAMU|nr:hypothetical protein [Amanita muscaria]QFZ98642.1 hypothetical protein [Amanita muscaria]